MNRIFLWIRATNEDANGPFESISNDIENGICGGCEGAAYLSGTEFGFFKPPCSLLDVTEGARPENEYLNDEGARLREEEGFIDFPVRRGRKEFGTVAMEEKV